MVYAVVGGEYSDWYLVGYCETEEQAKAYCEEYNNARIRKWQDELYVMPLANLESEQFDGKPICYSVDVRDWSYWKESWYELATVPPNRMIVDDSLYDEPTIQIWIYPAELKRIIKIAQDKYAEWKAEREGII